MENENKHEVVRFIEVDCGSYTDEPRDPQRAGTKLRSINVDNIALIEADPEEPNRTVLRLGRGGGGPYTVSVALPYDAFKMHLMEAGIVGGTLFAGGSKAAAKVADDTSSARSGIDDCDCPACTLRRTLEARLAARTATAPEQGQDAVLGLLRSIFDTRARRG